jgi:GNAT superfamily N-acetyltransferase
MEWTLRAADLSDWMVCAAFLQRMVENERRIECSESQAKTLGQTVVAILSGAGVGWVAEADEVPVGVLLGRTSADEIGRRVLMVFGLYVQPQWRMHGVAAGLVEACREYAEANGFDALEFTVEANSRTGWYERLGAQHTESVYRLELAR